MARRLATPVWGPFFGVWTQTQESVFIKKAVGKARKHRSLLVGIVIILAGVGGAAGGISVPAALMVDGADAPDGLIVEEVPALERALFSLPPSLFGGSFVGETPVAFVGGGGASGGLEENSAGVVVHSSAVASILSPVTTEAGVRRPDVQTYAVQSGDTPAGIASRFGVSTNTILWANNLFDGSVIRPGDTLKIPPVTGLLHTVASRETVSSLAKRFRADASAIIAFNALSADGSLRAGDTLMIPDGVRPRPAIAASSRRFLSSLPSVSGYFIFPAPGYRSQGLHGYNAVDIAHGGCYAYNVPVYAAASGTVTTADASGWNGGFGKFVKVQHPNGTATLYAHLREVSVGSGASVAQGQIVGFMGSTGRSTGCHVHFEVHGARNPFAF